MVNQGYDIATTKHTGTVPRLAVSSLLLMEQVACKVNCGREVQATYKSLNSVSSDNQTKALILYVGICISQGR